MIVRMTIEMEAVTKMDADGMNVYVALLKGMSFGMVSYINYELLIE
jgi:hypothetical protein